MISLTTLAVPSDDLMQARSSVSKWLQQADPNVFSAYCILAAFSTYFCMYAFRKPFTAGEFEGAVQWGIALKTVLVASQVAGYTLSKFVGIKVVSEMPASRRAATILGLIAFAEGALLAFALVPLHLKFVMLFFNGLPLGMVFGLVLAYLEGRQVTEALSAGLCASFIVSSGIVKSVGRFMVRDWGVSEYWMPFLTGLLFVVPLVVSVWLLQQIPKPSSSDVIHRTERTTMNRRDRWSFFKRHWLGLCGLLLIYMLLTVMRSIRDDFAVEIWRDLGHDDKPEIFGQSEMLVMFGVVVINGAAIWIGDNRKAFLNSLALITGGFVLVLMSLVGHSQGILSPFLFMVLAGLGMYIPYVAFHTTVFERLIAAFRESGNIGYLMYLADATGYLGYVGVMLLRNFGWIEGDFLSLFVLASLLIALLAICVTLFLIAHYAVTLPRATNDPLTHAEE